MDKKMVHQKLFLRMSVMLLPLSIGFLAVVITLMTLWDRQVLPFILPIVSIISGVFLARAGRIFRDRLRFHFAACFLFLSGGLLLLLDFGLVTIALPSVWPFLMLFVGISFLVSGVIRYQRPHPIYIVPALVFSALGFVFLLFSTNVIRVSIFSVLLWWFSLILAPIVVAFVLWLIRRLRARLAED